MVKIDQLESLPERMAQHEKLFNDMLHLIPAKYYIAQKQEFNNSPYMHNKRKLKAPKQEIKERSKKARKAKLDPENEKSIAELQSEQAEQAAKEKEEKEQNNNDDDDDEDASMDEAAVDDDEDDNDDVDDNDDATSSSSISMTKGDFSGLNGDKPEIVLPTAPSKPMVRSDITDLHTRLQQRIAEMRQNRNAPKAKSREEILKQRAKKREDRKKAHQKQKEKKTSQGPAEELVKMDNQSTKRSAADSVKMDGDLYFGKVAIGEEKKKKGAVDAKQQLKKLESQKEKLEQLRKEDKQKALELEEREQWDKALALASGEKIKDDTKLLKKTIKSKEQQKKKSAGEWQKRLEKVKMDEKNKIKKREENIRNHTKAKKSGENRKKKGGKGNDGKKKKARHGFEGAAFGYGGKVSKSKK